MLVYCAGLEYYVGRGCWNIMLEEAVGILCCAVCRVKVERMMTALADHVLRSEEVIRRTRNCSLVFLAWRRKFSGRLPWDCRLLLPLTCVTVLAALLHLSSLMVFDGSWAEGIRIPRCFRPPTPPSFWPSASSCSTPTYTTPPLRYRVQYRCTQHLLSRHQ